MRLADRAAEQQHVLVAEDEMIAQRVARRHLEAMGYVVTIVADGVDAVNACAQREFGLVLMDLQMSDMDGLRAAQEIRRQERPGRRVPIFGLSASAARDELANCIAAGMNGLLTKPLQRAGLHRALEELGLARPAPVLTPEDSKSVDPVEKPADLAMLRAKFGDDALFVQRLCGAFLASVSQLVNELGRAAEAGERTALKALAHKIKGAAANMHAHRIARLAAGIESGSSSMPLPELSQAVEALGRAFAELNEYISSELQ